MNLTSHFLHVHHSLVFLFLGVNAMLPSPAHLGQASTPLSRFRHRLI
ncbi:MAG: hypothetical protein LBO66_01675 [Deltaproteobacteria bacterium]|nr:hypothetical protein [Deltaproteobacteria bacterium]